MAIGPRQGHRRALRIDEQTTPDTIATRKIIPLFWMVLFSSMLLVPSFWMIKLVSYDVTVASTTVTNFPLMEGAMEAFRLLKMPLLYPYQCKER